MLIGFTYIGIAGVIALFLILLNVSVAGARLVQQGHKSGNSYRYKYPRAPSRLLKYRSIYSSRDASNGVPAPPALLLSIACGSERCRDACMCPRCVLAQGCSMRGCECDICRGINSASGTYTRTLTPASASPSACAALCGCDACASRRNM
jgi:hypothetical protein